MRDLIEEYAEKRAKKAAKQAAYQRNVEVAKGLLADGMSIDFTVRHAKLSL